MPLPDTKRKQILDQIITLLNDITKANGYNTDLAATPGGTISRNINSIANASANQMPFVSIMFNNMAFLPETANQSERIIATYIFDLYVGLTADGQDAYEELDKLLADIEITLIKGGPANIPTQFEKVSLQGLSFVEDVQKQSFFNDQGELAMDGLEFAWGRLSLDVTYTNQVTDP